MAVKEQIGSCQGFFCVWTHLSRYFAGVISLPYAEIVEPFEGWFDLKAKSSRIDYYNGMGPQDGCLCFTLMFWICEIQN